MSGPQTQGLNSATKRDTPQRVFVYGTLKKGCRNHESYLRHCKELGEGEVEGIMFHLGGFPAINLTERFSHIKGEVYEVTQGHIDAMDRLEGVAYGHYTRIETVVRPHGVVWTYIYTHDKAAKLGWIIPSGVWRGSNTPKVRWGGFGKGVEIGTYEADPIANEIRIGEGTEEPKYILRFNTVDNSYKLINKRTGEVHGSYLYLRDVVGQDGKTKPLLRLPAQSRTTIEDGVKEVLQNDGKVVAMVPPDSAASAVHQDPRLPIIWTPPEYKGGGSRVPLLPPLVPDISDEEEDIPQAARLLGYKYGEA